MNLPGTTAAEGVAVMPADAVSSSQTGSATFRWWRRRSRRKRCGEVTPIPPQSRVTTFLASAHHHGDCGVAGASTRCRVHARRSCPGKPKKSRTYFAQVVRCAGATCLDRLRGRHKSEWNFPRLRRLSGRSDPRVRGELRRLKPGDVSFVAAGREHHFVDYDSISRNTSRERPVPDVNGAAIDIFGPPCRH